MSATEVPQHAAITPESATQFLLLLTVLVDAFGDPMQVEKDFHAIYPEMDMNDAEFIGAGRTLPELYVAYVLAFSAEVLNNPTSRYHRLSCASDGVNGYLNYFDVKPKGPDALKYVMQFGLNFEHYLSAVAERPIIAALVRMRTLRLLYAFSGQVRADRKPPPLVMVRKILKIWRNEKQHQMLGWYGTYMLFKTWSLG